MRNKLLFITLCCALAASAPAALRFKRMSVRTAPPQANTRLPGAGSFSTDEDFR